MTVYVPDRPRRRRQQFALPLDPSFEDKSTRMPGGPLESEVQRAVMAMLAHHPLVAFAHRINSRVVDVVDKRKPGNTRPMRTAPKGHPDIAGMLVDGRALYVEVKRASGGALTPEQSDFLSRVEKHGGVAIVARCVDDVLDVLPLKEASQ